jgi:alpha-D-ribose 1-methylphosphonate 5-triphosphate synthase subunit PhnH
MKTFDAVHQTQRLYRKLLDAMARPGTVRSVADEYRGLPFESGGETVAAAIALTLIDGEVAFSFDLGGSSPETLAEWIRKRTFGRITAPDKADYVFAPGMPEETEIMQRYGRIRTGSLMSPEDGATVLLLVSGFGRSGESGHGWTLTGPGIADETELSVTGLSPVWMELRGRWNELYPMGVDMILFSPDGELAALPRTTRCTRSAW